MELILFSHDTFNWPNVTVKTFIKIYTQHW